MSNEYTPPNDWNSQPEPTGDWVKSWQDLVETPLLEMWGTFSDEQKKAIAHSLSCAAMGWQSDIEYTMGDDL